MDLASNSCVYLDDSASRLSLIIFADRRLGDLVGYTKRASGSGQKNETIYLLILGVRGLRDTTLL